MASAPQRDVVPDGCERLDDGGLEDEAVLTE
jgi:hypothetical protein